MKTLYRNCPSTYIRPDGPDHAIVRKPLTGHVDRSPVEVSVHLSNLRPESAADCDLLGWSADDARREQMKG